MLASGRATAAGAMPGSGRRVGVLAGARGAAWPRPAGLARHHHQASGGGGPPCRASGAPHGCGRNWRSPAPHRRRGRAAAAARPRAQAPPPQQQPHLAAPALPGSSWSSSSSSSLSSSSCCSSSGSIGSGAPHHHRPGAPQARPQPARRRAVAAGAASSSAAFPGPDGWAGEPGGGRGGFLSAFWRFLRPHTIRGTILGTSAVVAKVLSSNADAIDWGLLPRALLGLAALLAGNGYIVGINQIYDVDIDAVNKPFLPVAAGDLSPATAWVLVLGLAAGGLSVVAANFGPLITGLYAFGLALGTVYSVPPLRLKRFAVPAFLIIATVRGFLLNFGVYYATRAALRLPFEWSPPILFITAFVTVFATVIAITKDLPDVEGDRANDISTFATRLGVKNVSLLGVGMLLGNYVMACALALRFSAAFNVPLVLAAHGALAGVLLLRAAKLHAAGYTQAAVNSFYRWIWNLFYSERLPAPAAARAGPPRGQAPAPARGQAAVGATRPVGGPRATMRAALALLLAGGALLLAAAPRPARGYEYEYDGGYDGLYGDDMYYDYLDDYGYYGDDADSYYEEYGYYADDDFFGYDDYYDEYYDYYDDVDAPADCSVEKDGRVKLANGTAPCDIRITGVDKQADKLPGGLDGVYKLTGCHDGRPSYKRAGSPPGEDRVLWYSRGFGDWDVSKGPEPTEADILMYGGDIEHHPVPLFVKAWHLGGDLKSGGGANASAGGSDDVYVPVAARLACADGTVVKPPPVNPAVQKAGPILTDAEIEAKYKLIYEKYGRRPEPNPSLNFSFVIMLVMVGLAIVLAIPYALVRKRGGAPGAKGYQPVATSFAAVIQQSKKKQSGHAH
ncbi:hypothetical protein HT031_005581 [Scenedesmus sp. PABB004]|nr:hypothetical protein HT031_005581 [Scenedesmus sp. PABB004]